MYHQDPELEKQEIKKKYRELFTIWKPKNPGDRKMVRNAFRMAVEAHRGMRRKSGEPYIFHPISVAQICATELRLGVTSITCALLHDVVEDTHYTLEDIEGVFGSKVASIIDGLTKIKGLFDYNTSSIPAENFKKILLTLSDDVRVILIKLADRLHNMRTLEALSRDKQIKICSETTYLYAPLANRLGLHALKTELEDLALKYTEPDIYELITRRLLETAPERDRFVNDFVVPIKKALKEKGFDFDIYHREKSKAAIYLKMKKKGVPFEEIYDIFAVRIVINSPWETEKADCWKVYSAITDEYKPNLERLRDWISIPKANGYEALHTTVMSNTGKWVEVQIRSHRMDEIAEMGYAAHWKYKEALHLNSRLDNWLDRIREMIQSPESDALLFLDDVKGYFFLDEISVFTPQGELRTLPAGSTVLDFAYAIHSELGNTCIGAKVDKKLVPITHKLGNGQQVEIITSKKQSPADDWLDFVMTTRAKSSIKLMLREEKKKFSRTGKEKLQGWFAERNLPFNHENTIKFRDFCNFSDTLDLYYAAAKDKISVKDVALFADPKAEFELASCCNPIPGDNMIGLCKPDSPIVVHRSNCPKVPELVAHYGNKLVMVDWDLRSSFSFLATIQLHGIDRKGLISEITRIISNDLDLNIKSFHIEAVEGITHGDIVLYVNHLQSLQDVMERLRHVDGLKSIDRAL